MQVNRTVLVGAGAGVVGLLLGLAIGSSGKSELEARVAAQDEIRSGVASLSQAVGAIDQRLGGLDGRIGGVEGTLAGLRDAGTGDLEGLGQRIEGVKAAMGEAVSGVGTRVSEALSGDIDALRTEVAALKERAAAGAALLAEDKPAPAPDAEASSGAGEALRVGQTVVFGDGGARVFLSAADPEAGTARVAVNGQQLQVLALRSPAAAGDCTLTLTGFADGGATIAGDCGTAAAEAPAPQGTGVGTGVEIGKLAIFGDGAVRVFLSAVDAASGTARVAINGTTISELRMAEPVEAGDCKLELTGIDGQGATLDAAC